MTNDSDSAGARDLHDWAEILASAYALLGIHPGGPSGDRADLPELPQELNELSGEDAYRVQDLTLEHLNAAYGATGRGYKVGGGASLMCGVLLDRALLDTGSTVEIEANNVPLVEPEILLRSTVELSGDVSISDIADNVELSAGFELPIGRFRRWHPMAPGSAITLTSMVADNGLAGLVVLSGTWRPGLAPTELAEVSAEVRLPDGAIETGRANPMVGTAYETTQWLIRTLAQRGRVLRQGSIVATGTLLPARPATAGEYSARFSHDLGEVRFTAV